MRRAEHHEIFCCGTKCTLPSASLAPRQDSAALRLHEQLQGAEAENAGLQAELERHREGTAALQAAVATHKVRQPWRGPLILRPKWVLGGGPDPPPPIQPR